MLKQTSLLAEIGRILIEFEISHNEKASSVHSRQTSTDEAENTNYKIAIGNGHDTIASRREQVKK